MVQIITFLMKVWEGKELSSAIALQWSNSFIAEWQACRAKMKKANANQGRTADVSEIKWKRPVENRVKINVDASLVAGDYSFAIGMVIRDHKGGFIQEKNNSLPRDGSSVRSRSLCCFGSHQMDSVAAASECGYRD